VASPVKSLPLQILQHQKSYKFVAAATAIVQNFVSAATGILLSDATGYEC